MDKIIRCIVIGVVFCTFLIVETIFFMHIQGHTKIYLFTVTEEITYYICAVYVLDISQVFLMNLSIFSKVFIVCRQKHSTTLRKNYHTYVRTINTFTYLNKIV